MTMTRGKDTCRILKEIRRQIAEANDIEFITSECRYKGDCLGTCPKCEAEVRYIEQQLRLRSLTGKAVALAGISVSTIAMSMPLPTNLPIQPNSNSSIDKIHVAALKDTLVVKGKIFGKVTSKNETKEKLDTIIGATIHILNTNEGSVSDFEGNFEINACRGDSIVFSYIGYQSQIIQVRDATNSINVILEEDPQILMGETAVLAGAVSQEIVDNNYTDLNIVDEKGNCIDIDNLCVERIFFDEEGKEDYEEFELNTSGENKPFRIYWNTNSALKDEDGNPLNKATLRIKADGYEERMIIKLKRPKRHSQKTIQFKHKKSE